MDGTVVGYPATGDCNAYFRQIFTHIAPSPVEGAGGIAVDLRVVLKLFYIKECSR